MADLVQLEKQFLAHNLQCADLARVLLLGQIDLSIASLTDLSEDLEVALPQARPSLAQIGALTTEILCKGIIVLCLRCLGRRRILGLKL